jgi:hypothetical protein
MHSKEQQLQSDYYNQLAEIIKKYHRVLLYGPTNAKEELNNKLVGDHKLHDVRIHVQHADKMTDNQKHAFVKDYFIKHPD